MSSTPSTTSTPAPTPPYNGYALTKVRRAGGAETERFEAVLTRDGRPIAHVANGGEGGSHRWSPIDPDGWAAIDQFNEFAAAWNAGSELAGIEDGDQLVNRLLEVDQLNRKRSLPFLLDGADFWTSGEYAVFRGATPAQTLEALRSPMYSHRQPRVWSREVGDFIPVG
ncbi:hypothetical protein [Cellulomonas soli]|uniref:Uncharacterized protein n=1 Tax=Cellulomonas soli TaxID=931535 RepID=A0A512PDT1_9CELL|nr:hypothetical protein [Cellulomonas soli]NYI59138.1 hypothetical protein [Cellulomonas soli]GEP69370.1 hypothetical protein CSO01_20850 [Cellulomonas soli]